MFNHIIKYDYRDGVKLAKHDIETWCGCKPEFSDWLFQDAQHALLVMERGGRIMPCKSCLENIIRTASNHDARADDFEVGCRE